MYIWNRATLPALAAFVLLSALAASAQAGDLSADRLVAVVGESVTLQLRSANENIADAPWTADQIAWLFIRGEGTQRNIPRARYDNPDATSIEVRLTQPGVTMIGVDRRPQVQQWPAARVRETLQGLVDDVKLPAADGDAARVRVIESSKIILRVVGDDPRRGRQSAVAQSKSGQQVELRLMADPARVPIGSDLPVRAYVGGDKRPAARVTATHVESGTVQESLATRDGFVNLTVTAAGRWRIEMFAADAAEVGAEFDWIVYRSVVEFEAGGPEADE